MLFYGGSYERAIPDISVASRSPYLLYGRWPADGGRCPAGFGD